MGNQEMGKWEEGTVGYALHHGLQASSMISFYFWQRVCFLKVC